MTCYAAIYCIEQSSFVTLVRSSLVSAFLIFAVAFAPRPSVAFETKAKQALMIEAGSGTILFAKGADEKVAPASLAKLMTMETVFHALRQGDVRMTDEYPVSEYAWRTGGAPSRTATMFAALKSRIQLADLMRGVIVQSANDGCIVIAEGMKGSEEKFVEAMNARAQELGLTGSTFRNSSGLPADGQFVTMRDLVALGSHVWKTYPDYYQIYSEPSFTWNKIFQRNRNPLLSMGIGADGMGTGYTEESGFSLLGSVQVGDTRLFAAMAGMASDKERAEEARKMFDWGLNGFNRSELFKAEQIVGTARVFGGERSRVALKAAGSVNLLVPVGSEDRITARVIYQGPVAAPVAEGAPIGNLTIFSGRDIVQRTPLFAAESVGVGPLHSRAYDAIVELAFGWIR
jgi:D-alanyl-D-alanine carboxypeptidase (penicillin-binding protein 5/6)